ncbi:unnamed protein product [Lathyrus sativus]|nr:unnamed protein product [Lathyrus sativus]
MTLYAYITLFVAIFFIMLYNIWRGNKTVPPNWPIIGMLPLVFHNKSNIHDFVTSGLKCYGGTLHFKGPWFTNIANFILTSDPVNVHHITSRNFSNYGKGSDFHEIFEILGVSIINLDGNAWKQERALLHSLLRSKSFETSLQQNIHKKLQNCLLPFLDHHASKGAQVLDLQNIIERFTFDITCTFLFGFDPNCLPHKFNDELLDTSFVKAIYMLEEMVLSRHYIPKCFWKLQKWLQIGQEKKNKAAQEILHQFLSKCIAYAKGVDESHSCLLKQLMEEKKVDNEKYIRDTAVSLLGAGNGTISSGLSWFFWLVSTHPIVETKIIQEIKNYCLANDDDLMTSLSVEKLNKLVYLHGAICEALRLYPPIPFEHKCARKSDILPSGDYVSPNTKLIYSLYAMGRMEKIWGNDCLEFKPERWISSRGGVVYVPSYKFIVFNAGPRSCLGKDITFVQMKMVAAALLWKFHIEAVEGHTIAPRNSMILRMEYGFKVKVCKRSI